MTITITPEGTKLLKKAPSLLQDQFRDKLARLKHAEQQNMLRVLRQIGEMMGAAALVAAPILVTGPEALAAPEKKSPRRKRETGGVRKGAKKS